MESRKARFGKAALDVILFGVLATLFMMILTIPLTVVFKRLGEGGGEATMELLVLNEALMLVAVFLAAWAVLRFRRLPLTALGLSLQGRVRDLWGGMLFACVLYAVGFGLSLLLGAVQVSAVSFHPALLLQSFMLFVLVALVEELAVRGFLLGRMLDAGVNKYGALLLSSVIFSLLHLFNPNFAFLPFLNILLAGILLGSSYIYTRNLCFPVALHLFWNWLQGPVLGYEVSGNRFGEGVLTLRLSDASLLNGGAFGFEGSLLCTVLMMAGIVYIHYKYRDSAAD